MPRKAAGERALRIARTVAAATLAAAGLALVAGCGAGDGSPIAFGAGSGATTPAASAGPTASPSPNGELTEPAATTATADDDATLPDDTGSFDFSFDPSYEPSIDPGLLLPTLPNDSPYGDGTCFEGPKVTSTTPIDVSNMDEVDCSSSDADYKVVQTILDTTDLNKCDNVSDAQYAFSESDSDGYGDPLWSAVYCLAGLGSYAE